ncbi:signal recognition particle-docking protein FtsY [Enterococcus sp. AZ109]|uniref:signal recognition particle-docking protein FtsY n=1 Tax=Enterococcus sp. AZ109 TaxID=2774634 RepID=UPI003F2245CB
MGLFDRIKNAFKSEKKEEQETPESTELQEPEAEDTDHSAVEGQTAMAPEETSADDQADSEEAGEPSGSLEIEETAPIEEVPKESVIEEATQPEEVQSVEILPESELEAPVATEDVMEEISAPAETTAQEKYDKGLEKTRKSFGDRMNELFARFRRVDEEFFEELEETLIGADVGFDTAIKLTESLRQEVKLKNAKKQSQIQNVIIEKLVDIYEAEGVDENNQLNLQPEGLSIILFVGVNGTGKTTSIGKLANQYKNEGKRVLLAAADTFRAGAIDQLVVWGQRSGVEVVRGKAGGDPAAVVYDAVDKAKNENYDILLIDTAGRLQNKVNLMNELKKIKRVIQREYPTAPHEVLLVVDATTGQNALSQARQFKETTDITGLVLTKLDGTAKGGIVLAIRNELHLPVKLVGLGEKIDDLAVFDPNDFAIGLFKGLLKEE